MSEYNEAIEAAANRIKAIYYQPETTLGKIVAYVRMLKRPEPQGVTASSAAAAQPGNIVDLNADIIYAVEYQVNERGGNETVDEIVRLTIAALNARHYPEPQPAGDVGELVGRLREACECQECVDAERTEHGWTGSVGKCLYCQAAALLQRLAARSGEGAGVVERVAQAIRASKDFNFDGLGDDAHALCLSLAQTAISAIRATDRHDDEIGWLLERPSSAGSALYHSLIVGHPWETTDHAKALRFARKEDAEAYIAAGFVGEDEYRAIEHMWCAPPRSAAPSAEVER